MGKLNIADFNIRVLTTMQKGGLSADNSLVSFNTSSYLYQCGKDFECGYRVYMTLMVDNTNQQLEKEIIKTLSTSLNDNETLIKQNIEIGSSLQHSYEIELKVEVK